MAEREEGIWGGEAEVLGRKLTLPTAEPPSPNRTGAEWGLAALVAGGACFLLCPGALLVWVAFVHADFWSHSDRRILSVIFTACHFLAFGLTAVAMAFAITGLTAARKQQTPVALPLTALILSGVTLLFWILILICTICDAASI